MISSTSAYVNLEITNNISAFASSKRFPKDVKIAEFKTKLELITGCDWKNMKLQLFDNAGNLLCDMDNDDSMLGAYPVEDNYRIHVTDPTKTGGEFDSNQESTETFDLSYDEYAKKTDSVLAWKKKNKFGQFKEVTEEEREKQRQNEEQQRQLEDEHLATMKVGNRCEVKVPKQPTRRGTVMFLGTTDFKEGNWVGVRYDEPLGKNNGSVGGKQYFQCPEKYGAFVKPLSVTVGDFPEIGLDDLDEL